jgi:hypothetical protein
MIGTAIYPVRQTGQAREFDYDHRDLAQQQRLLAETFAGEGLGGAAAAHRPAARP